MKARLDSRLRSAVCYCVLRTNESSRGAVANSMCKLHQLDCLLATLRMCEPANDCNSAGLKLVVVVGWRSLAELMCRVRLEAAPPTYALVLAVARDALCVMGINFHWENFGGRRPPPQKEFPRGRHRTIGRVRQSPSRSCVSFAASIGIASTLQPFNVSRAKHSPFHPIPIAWACVLKVQN